MFFHHLNLYDRELVMRALFALIFVGMGIAMLAGKNVEFWMTGAACFFRKSLRLSPEQSARLQRALDSRDEVEVAQAPPQRFIGILAFVVAIAQLVPAIPYAIPYAIFCLGIAAAKLWSYESLRRATERRAAALVPRSPLQSFSPILFVAAAAALTGALVMFPLELFRAAVIVVALATAILVWIAWQVASGRALVFGNDPKMEYAVDRRVREGRVVNLIVLACAPAFLLAIPSGPFVPEADRWLSDLATWITAAANVGVGIAAVILWRRANAEFERAIA